MNKIVNQDSADLYNGHYGLETLHALVTVVDLRKAKKSMNDIQSNYGLYVIFLELYKSCDIRSGRRNGDYHDGTIVCFAPGQTISATSAGDNTAQPVHGLLFHPDSSNCSTNISISVLQSEMSASPTRTAQPVRSTVHSNTNIPTFCRLFKKRIGNPLNEYRMQSR